MKATITTLALGTALVLSMSAPVLAAQANRSQEGDYYAPTKTIVQQATPQELNEFRGGDYYAPDNTVVHQPTVQQLNAFRDGDFYAPAGN